MNAELSTRMDARIYIMNAVIDEIERQDQLKAEGRFDSTAFELADAPYINATILMEEAGEVARAIHEQKAEDLEEELIQVAAVAMAWLEGIKYAQLKRENAIQAYQDHIAISEEETLP